MQAKGKKIRLLTFLSLKYFYVVANPLDMGGDGNANSDEDDDLPDIKEKQMKMTKDECEWNLAYERHRHEVQSGSTTNGFHNVGGFEDHGSVLQDRGEEKQESHVASVVDLTLGHLNRRSPKRTFKMVLTRLERMVELREFCRTLFNQRDSVDDGEHDDEDHAETEEDVSKEELRRSREVVNVLETKRFRRFKGLLVAWTQTKRLMVGLCRG